MQRLHELTTDMCCDVVSFGTMPQMQDVLAVAMYELNETTQERHGKVRCACDLQSAKLIAAFCKTQFVSRVLMIKR
jgi:hypothetical protein